ncbi:pyridoxamine 5'-phosphate oxidase family protein [Micromonospora sp. DT81.3]|uniref:pyridoxamine 5'-phosphate oxidase family protein n=1 Tax=Micromonospora sp. DT81.3 TaxID=3416523 RepID=UPI003CF27D2E
MTRPVRASTPSGPSGMRSAPASRRWWRTCFRNAERRERRPPIRDGRQRCPRSGAARARPRIGELVPHTCDGADGMPWATPVWFAARELDLFVWASKPGARHSRNIAENPRVSLVIFDSSKAPGEGSALYVSADAGPVDDATFEDALSVYNARSLESGLREWGRAQLSGAAKHRLYRALTLDSFVLDDHDERIRV